ncbi:acyl carrier protein [Streptomyces sp. 8N616]|uniref:acyl carrier protein n=1 Tax=Streptomyces sp. 8N616 TaxID=3457414 RepID=UPI003FD3376F
MTTLSQRAATTRDGRTPAPDLEALRNADVDERTRVIEDFICQELTRVLDIPPAYRVDARRPLHTQGVGSIIGLQLKRLLELALDVEVGVLQVLRTESVAELAAKLALLMEDPLGGPGEEAALSVGGLR